MDLTQRLLSAPTRRLWTMTATWLRRSKSPGETGRRLDIACATASPRSLRTAPSNAFQIAAPGPTHLGRQPRIWVRLRLAASA